MAQIFGASLGELLRHGSQFGLGVQDAGRQNAKNQYDVDKARREELQQALIDQANIDQSRASAARDRAYVSGQSGPRPLTENQSSGAILPFLTPKRGEAGITDEEIAANVVSANPGADMNMIRAAIDARRRQQATDLRSEASASRAGSGEVPRGQLTANARGYAETLALQLTTNPSVKTDPTLRKNAEGFAVQGLLGRYPQLGADEAAAMVRREFRNVLDETGSVAVLSGPAAEAWARTYGSPPPDTIP